MNRKLFGTILVAAILGSVAVAAKAQSGADESAVVSYEVQMWQTGLTKREENLGPHGGPFQRHQEAKAWAEQQLKAHSNLTRYEIIEVRSKRFSNTPKNQQEESKPDDSRIRPRPTGNEQQKANRFKEVLDEYLAKLPPEERDRFKAKFLESLKTKGREQAKFLGFTDKDFDAIVKQAETTIADTPFASSYEPPVTSLRRQFNYDSDGNRNSGRPIGQTPSGAQTGGTAAAGGIVGTWTASSNGLRKRYEFKADGSFSLEIKSPYFWQGKHGTWSKQGAEITAQFEESGRAGTGGFSRARELPIRILSSSRMQIDGDSATKD